MRTIIMLCLLLISSVVDAKSVKVVVGQPTAAAPSADVVYYFNCNSATSGQSPSKGAGTVTIGASVTAVTGAVGNGLSGNSTGWSTGAFYTSTDSGVIDYAIGTIGFYINRAGDPAVGYLVSNGGTATGTFNFNNGAGNTNYGFNYQSGNQVITLSGNSTTYFIELAWSHAGAKMSYRVDGGSWTEATSLTGDTPTGTNLRFLNGDGNGFSGWMDQIIISDNYQEDLYAVRDNTSF